MKHEFTLVYERGDDDWWIATVAEYPGAFSQGKTIDEARENALDALRELMLAQREMVEGEIVDKPDVVREVQVFDLA
jgi:predicted RNase H-like HicB family nuclease